MTDYFNTAVPARLGREEREKEMEKLFMSHLSGMLVPSLPPTESLPPFIYHLKFFLSPLAYD